MQDIFESERYSQSFKTMQLILLLCCSLVVTSYGHTCPGDQPDHTSDTRWRLVSGLDASSIYTLYSQMREMLQPPLINASAAHTTDRVHSVIDGVCNLVSFYELVSRAKKDSELHVLLTAAVEDSCHWLHYLVASHSHVVSSREFAELPPSCTAADTTRLHIYCLQRRIRSEQLRLLIHRDLSDSLHSYYRGNLPIAHPRNWVRSSSFSSERQKRLLDII